jgi:hypothetical protein
VAQPLEGKGRETVLHADVATHHGGPTTDAAPARRREGHAKGCAEAETETEAALAAIRRWVQRAVFLPRMLAFHTEEGEHAEALSSHHGAQSVARWAGNALREWGRWHEPHLREIRLRARIL